MVGVPSLGKGGDIVAPFMRGMDNICHGMSQAAVAQKSQEVTDLIARNAAVYEASLPGGAHPRLAREAEEVREKVFATEVQ